MTKYFRREEVSREKALRERLGLTQREFAETPARALLLAIERDPKDHGLIGGADRGTLLRSLLNRVPIFGAFAGEESRNE
jgi:hypothetical protein